jgi:putative salt-induced outer membrane protein
MKFYHSSALAMAAPFLLALTTNNARAETEPGQLWSGDAELGYVATGGNSDTSSLKARTDIKRESDPWRYLVHADAFNASENSSRTAEKYFLSNKLDYKFSDRSYIFGFASYEHDSFSGFAWQGTAASGVGYRIIQNDTMTWDVETGPGYRVSKVDDSSEGSDQHEVILRLSTKYSWKLSDTATFEQEASVESGADNTVTRSITSLRTAIVGRLAMKLSYTLKNSSHVPSDTKHTDTETAVTLVYSF